MSRTTTLICDGCGQEIDPSQHFYSEALQSTNGPPEHPGALVQRDYHPEHAPPYFSASLQGVSDGS